MIPIISSVTSLIPIISFISHLLGINTHSNKWLDVRISPHSHFASPMIPHLFKFTLVLPICVLRRLRVFHIVHGRSCPAGKSTSQSVSTFSFVRSFHFSIRLTKGIPLSGDVVFMKYFLDFNPLWVWLIPYITCLSSFIHSFIHSFVFPGQLKRERKWCFYCNLNFFVFFR